MSECYEKHIYGSSSRLLKQDGIKDDFDLFIFTAGWESRCIEIREYDNEKFNFNSAMIISFRYGEDLGYLSEYMDKLKSFINVKIPNGKFHPIEHEPNDLDKITIDINNIINKIIFELKRPLKIGFDISSCPRYFILYLLGYCLENRLAQKLSFFYSEGKYSGDIEDYVHTKGDWKIIEVPNFEALYDPEDKKMFVVSAGFEGNRFRSLVAKYEPDTIGILMPDPGFNKEYTKKVEKECKPLIDDFNIPADSILRAPAGDAIAAWKALKAPSLNKEKYHIAYLTFGPKPHILAMGIHGYLNKKISVTYRIPDGYTKMEVEPTGIFWRYDIKNLALI